MGERSRGERARNALRRQTPHEPLDARRRGCMSTSGPSGVERIAAAFAGAGGRAALMPYLMAGFPTLRDSIEIGRACVRAGADLLELGVPYSDPPRRRSGDPRRRNPSAV